MRRPVPGKSKTTKMKKSQSIFEYAAFIGIIALGLITMQVYVQRGLQGKLKDLARQISPSQYSPKNTTSNYRVIQAQQVKTHKQGARTQREVVMFTNRVGNESTLLEYEEFAK